MGDFPERKTPEWTGAKIVKLAFPLMGSPQARNRKPDLYPLLHNEERGLSSPITYISYC